MMTFFWNGWDHTCLKQKIANVRKKECDEWKARAEKAERERDRALADAACAHAVSRGHGVQVDALEKERDEWKARAERLAALGRALVDTTPGEWVVEVDGQLFHDLDDALEAEEGNDAHKK
jgi:hypothetical protein